MKSGILVSWHANGYGMVAVGIREKYFLHYTEICELPEELNAPTIGSRIDFEVAPARGAGKFPRAVSARVVPQNAPSTPSVLGEGGEQ